MPGKKRKGVSRKKTARKKHSAKAAGPDRRSTPNAKDYSPGGVIRRARHLYHQNRIEEAIELLRTLDQDAAFASDREKLDYYRLLVFSFANTGRLAEAETYLRRGLELDPEDRDFYFSQAFIFVSYKNFDKTLECSRRFVELYEKGDKPGVSPGYLSDDSLHHIYNYMGIAYKARRDSDEAEKALAKSIELKPSYEHAYLNLADLYRRRGEYQKAAEVVNRGLQHCSQVQELRMLEKVLENRATICACMIVKNEEELLPTCLESIRSWIDDIIIVDTGSTDRTVEIARSYGAKVYFQKWEGNFSRARNYSLSRATCDWILYIDADEEFVQEDVPLLRQAIAQDKCRMISVNIYNVKKETGECTSSLVFNRIFRSDAGFSFDGIVHNQLVHEEEEQVLSSNIRLKHYGYNLAPEKMKQKSARSRALLEKQLAENPDFAFAHFNLAQLLRSVRVEDEPMVHELVEKHAKRTIELTDPTLAIHLMAHHQLVTTYINMKRYEDAEKYARLALEIKPDYLDPLLSLGHIYYALKRPDSAEEYYKKYLDAHEAYLKSPVNEQIILLSIQARHVAYYHLGLLKLQQGAYSDAEAYLLKALQELDPYLDSYLALTRIYLERKEVDKAITYIEKELAWHPDSDLAHLYKGRYFVLIDQRQVAEKYYLKALELTADSAEVLRQAGCFLTNQGCFEHAVPALKKLTEMYPNYIDGWMYLAKACYGYGQYRDALDAYRRYLEFRPDDAEIINDLANCYFKLQDYKNAETHFARALEVNSDLAYSYRNLGLVKLHLGKLKEALTLLESYTSTAPDDVEIELAIGNIYRQMGRYGDAIPHFERFLATDSSNTEALYSISECYRQLGYAESAVIGYRQILKINPDFEPAKQRLLESETPKTPA
ncbi:MAG: tetratricopeptide repeat protein [Candidatus Zixiibacteriota bacterium]|nr:MAG: tetratricopeptide repeat protein [candidate division Zixibacteria bacterium]